MRWLRPSSGTKRAPGMPAASRRPGLERHARVVAACITSVGTLTCGSSAVTSTSPFARRFRAASSAELEIRCSSLNQSACSLLRAGNELGGEHLPEGRVFLPPAQPHQRQHGVIRLLLGLGPGALVPADGDSRRRGSDATPARDAGPRRRSRPRSPGRCRAARTASMPAASTTASRSSTNRSNVTSGDLTVRQPVAAGVVADESVVPRQLLVEMPPDRTFEDRIRGGSSSARS